MPAGISNGANNYDEYFVVVQGEYKLKINGETMLLTKGDEYHVPKGIPHSGESKKGTRTIYAFGSKRAKRINEGQQIYFAVHRHLTTPQAHAPKSDCFVCAAHVR
jgi:uncharacterized cupin superfamily protein